MSYHRSSRIKARRITWSRKSFHVLSLLLGLSLWKPRNNHSNRNIFHLFVNANMHITGATVSKASQSNHVAVRVLFDGKGFTKNHFTDNTSQRQTSSPDRQEQRADGKGNHVHNMSLSSVIKIEDIVTAEGGFNNGFRHAHWFDLGETTNSTIENENKEPRPLSPPTTTTALPLSLESDQIMFTSPHGVLTTQNYVFISDSYRNVIEKRNVDGDLLETYGDGSKEILNFPTGMALWDNTLYICDSKNHRIVQMDIHTGEFLKFFGTYGLEAGLYFDFPRDIAFDSTGKMYIAEAGNRRIQKFSENGDFQLSFNGACGTMNKLRGSKTDPEQCRAACGSATGVAVDPEDNVYVSFPDKNVVVKYNNQGHQLHMYGKIGFTNREFTAPHSVSVDSTGHLYVVDPAKGWLTIFDGHDRFLGIYHGKRRPSYVAIDTSDNAYVVDFPI